MRKTRKTLFSRLTTKYILIIRNEENFEQKGTLTFNYSRLIFFLLVFFILCLALSSWLVTSVLKEWFDPREVQLAYGQRLEYLSRQVDSLEVENEQKQKFINNLRDIASGGEKIEKESENLYQSNQVENFNREVDLEKISPVDSQFRAEFETSGTNLVSLLSGDDKEKLQELFFFPPVYGIISSPYDIKKDHLGVDIVSKKNEPVKSVADGTVIFASWTQDGGHVISIQHQGDLISLYKHNSVLYKKIGDFVKAGEVIAINGNSGELTTGPHLHFELWYRGSPINPAEFISF